MAITMVSSIFVKYKFFWISLLIESTKYDIRWSATFNNNLYCYEHYPIIYLSFKLWYSLYQWILLLTKIDETTVFFWLLFCRWAIWSMVLLFKRCKLVQLVLPISIFFNLYVWTGLTLHVSVICQPIQ